jgi:hypothetical protein
MYAGGSGVPLWQRFLSGAVAAYPIPRGRTRLRRISSPWLVARLECGAWVRTSGVVEAEWGFLEGGAKEERTSQLVTSFLSNGMTFLDIGANVGYFSLLAASVVGSTGKVIAFEPTPAVADRLRENVLLNRLKRDCDSGRGIRSRWSCSVLSIRRRPGSEQPIRPTLDWNVTRRCHGHSGR